jgi:hypothetical protein
VNFATLVGTWEIKQRMTNEKTAKIKVLYIAGMTRSGSTILGSLLGEMPKAVHVGEIGLFARPHFGETAFCECLRTVGECDFWQAVFERAFGGFDTLDLESLQKTRNEYRLRTFPRLLLPQTANQIQRRREYLAVLDALYAAIQEVSGAEVIVDSSKDAFYGSLLNQVAAIDMHTVHLIRDSRAVAFSHQRIKIHAPFFPNSSQMPRYAPWKTALYWNAVTLLHNSIRYPHTTLLRYEDLVSDPQATLHHLWDWIGEPASALDFLKSSSVHMTPGHTVAGNPVRFQSEVKIKPDLEWQEKMLPKDRRLVTALTFPLLLRYGYLGQPPKEPK